MTDQDEVRVRLLCTKTRVAPLKLQTIPRLELCAVLTLTRLTRKATQVLRVSIDRIVYWSDSTIVLHWLQMQPNQLQVFVANRVAEVQELTDYKTWRHVPTQVNPADLLSRGLPPAQLQQSTIWWYGPSFLKKTEEEWLDIPKSDAPAIELKRIICTAIKTQLNSPSIFSITTNVRKLIRVVAYCKRFTFNCRNKDKREIGSLTAAELQSSLHNLAKLSQGDSFPTEVQTLKEGNSITGGRLATLNPFVDKEGIMRVGGKLTNSEFSMAKKYPIVLLANDQFTKLLFVGEHLRLLHAGPQSILNSIRQQFWPLGGRNLARKTVHDCVRCFRSKPQLSQTPIGELPRARVSLTTPFHTTGVHYAGPFNIKDRKELVSDLSSEAFIAALRRFSARRGKPAHIYSDNGTNFVGANRELKELAQFSNCLILASAKNNSIREAISEIGISWHFIPAHSPHFGGLWEAGVKSTIYHIRRVAGNAILTFEELYTLLTQIEAVLNSHPLIPISFDPNELTPLTPAHFLVGRMLTEPADPLLTETPESRLSRWQFIQSLQQHFWKRRSKEHIAELQQRANKKKAKFPINQGTMVLIKEDNLSLLKWKLGRVVSIHPGLRSDFPPGGYRIPVVPTPTAAIRERRRFTEPNLTTVRF
ncbi:PREDICTED: uncharacterized protein LOC105557366 [Vollenhovia emeryi]|uniref:uncharacterized protein LOC105557366 n=1 Tax=Vollenhovia emeryi TaxID=411798 RepID=UPI0005F4B080|nr:PREDICTED: uncharacterized protein LOC105557366 [Vollenhovia emeryi]